MNKEMNTITLEQTQSLVLKPGNSSNPKAVLALMSDIAQLGFYFDRKLLNVLKTLSLKELKEVRVFLEKGLLKIVGAHVTYEPLFRNFPEDVPNESEYLFKRLVGFIDNWLQITPESENAEKLSCGCIVNSDLFDVELFGACPICQLKTDRDYKAIKRSKLTDKVKFKKISLMTQAQFDEFVTNVLNSKVAYSEKTKAGLSAIVTLLDKNIAQFLPEAFTNKENLATFSSLIVKVKATSVNHNWYKTATDVLRLAVALSYGDVSLKEDDKFKLKSSERKLVLTLLDNIDSPLEDMLRYREKWLRLAEYLHVGAYRNRFVHAYKAIDILRNKPESIETFNRSSHQALLQVVQSEKVSKKTIDLLTKRPGEFARKLDLLLRNGGGSTVLAEFESIIDKVSTPILLKLKKHIGLRNKESAFRYYIPKGLVAKMHFQDGDTRPTISTKDIKKTQEIIETELLRRFNKGESAKKAFISSDLKKILVPLVPRNASKALSTVERGSRVSYDEKAKVLRMFVYWHESKASGRIDVDLSAAAYDKDWKLVTHLSWTSLGSLESVHSGDVQSAPNGASEFIDINVNSFKENRIRYVVMSVHSWTGQAFSGFECFAGLMERQHAGKGEVFEPKTVKNKFDIAGNSTSNIPMVLDLETNELIWADLSLGTASHRRIDQDAKKVSFMCKAVCQMEKTHPNLYELFMAHAQARGAIVHSEKKDGVKYDLVFNLEKSKDIADILANWI